jgi:hypothetical protein
VPQEERVERALPVGTFDFKVPLGFQRWLQLPDGALILTTFRGYRMRFSDLPAYPRAGEMYALAENPTHYWIWATPLGFTHPAWVDP